MGDRFDTAVRQPSGPNRDGTGWKDYSAATDARDEEL